jgi:plasmid stability protein
MAPEWRHGSILEALMGVSLSIKDVPEALAQRLRERAAANHRSLQRELVAIIEAAAAGSSLAPQVREEPAAYRVQAVQGHAELPPSSGDTLLAELDAIVAGSRWGAAPLLAREQAHERALAREIDFDARQAELDAARSARVTG